MGVKGCAIHLSFSPGNSVLNAYKRPKINPKEGGETIADYIKADTNYPPICLSPFPAENGDFRPPSSVFASVRPSTLSQKNKWREDEGRIYIIYPIAEIAKYWIKAAPPSRGRLMNWTRRGCGTGTGRLLRTEPALCESAASATGTVFRPTDGRKGGPHRAGKPSN